MRKVSELGRKTMPLYTQEGGKMNVIYPYATHLVKAEG
jgi:hypothetical protein